MFLNTKQHSFCDDRFLHNTASRRPNLLFVTYFKEFKGTLVLYVESYLYKQHHEERIVMDFQLNSQPEDSSCLATVRWELIPMKGVEDQIQALPPASHVAVTCSPSKGLEATLDLTEKVVRAGHRAAPHLSARMTDSEFTLKSVLRRLRLLGVTEAFLVGGDRAEPLGPYACSYDLLVAIRNLESSLETLGITGYPEGHPKISAELLHADLLRKAPLADYVVTQMCFESSVILDWLARMRELSFDLPVFVGIPGVVDFVKLARIATAIGVGDSVRFLRNNLATVARLARGFRPDVLVEGLSGHKVAGFHLYTFNRVAATADWLSQSR